MELHVIRTRIGARSTLGELIIAGEPDRPFCYTLEDQVREGPKVPKQTAIPAGRYRVDMTMSTRFKMVLPILLAVPGFDAIRIHAGNTAEDTEGCILVGLEQHMSPLGDTVTHSRDALAKLLPHLRSSIDAHHGVWISVA